MRLTGFVVSLLLGLVITIAAQAEYWIDIDEFSAFDRDRTTYDPDDDVVVTYLSDIMDEGWVAVQCGTSTVWYENLETHQWGSPRIIAEEYEYDMRDALCALRNSLPYQDF